MLKGYEFSCSCILNPSLGLNFSEAVLHAHQLLVEFVQRTWSFDPLLLPACTRANLLIESMDASLFTEVH